MHEQAAGRSPAQCGTWHWAGARPRDPRPYNRPSWPLLWRSFSSLSVPVPAARCSDYKRGRWWDFREGLREIFKLGAPNRRRTAPPTHITRIAVLCAKRRRLPSPERPVSRAVRAAMTRLCRRQKPSSGLTRPIRSRSGRGVTPSRPRNRGAGLQERSGWEAHHPPRTVWEEPILQATTTLCVATA